MRNYEIINEIYAELIAGSGKGQFTNPYLNTVITITKLIEKERPELKELADSAKQEVQTMERNRQCGLEIAEDGTVTSIK